MIQETLDVFKRSGIPIQITLDIDLPVTVHAIGHDKKLHKTEDQTLIPALHEMMDLLGLED
jgi:hypothetical protein